MLAALTVLTEAAGCINTADTMAEWLDALSGIHASALAIEVDFKEKVLSTTYTLRAAAIDAVVEKGILTRDLGGTASGSQVSQAINDQIRAAASVAA